MRFLLASAMSLALAVSALLPGVAAAQTAPSLYWGAYVDGAPFDTSRLDQFEASAGRRQSIVHWGQPWKMNGQFMAFQTAEFEAVRRRGSIPMINWNSWSLGASMDDPNFSLARIYNGAYDGYITSWAQAAKAWGHPFFMRFDHEMNGNWYPWSEQRNGNHSGEFVRMWRHVHDIFTRVGATNVTWLWCPNNVFATSIPLSGLYPGDSYVDWTGMDGYNKATNASNWLSLTQVLGDNPWSHMNTYNQLQAVAGSKPIMIAETATTNSGGDPGAWIRSALQTEIPRTFPKVKALVWFNWNGGDAALTFDVASTAGKKAAFQQSINSGIYAANNFANLPPGPIKPLSGAAPAPSSTPAPAPASAPASAVPSSAWQIRVQSGGAGYTSSDGRRWETDTAYSGGAVGNSSAGIGNTIDPALYQNERYGNFAYNFTVPNGTYTVDLKFAELYWKSAGQRIFNVTINGKQVLTNFDILAQPGAAPNTAVDKTFSTTVTGGTLNIAFSTVKDNAQVTAIEIIPGTPTRIDAGGAGYTGPDARSWAADRGFSGGTTFSTAAWIARTFDSNLYHSLRNGSNFSYTANVPNGQYRVVLKFAELYWTSAGKRVFNVAINNQAVLSNFDILTQAGPNTAVDKSFPVTVTNGSINIAFGSVVDTAQVNGIEILPD